jgi:gamma-glutamyl-gamma-aminobutyrate hydrolase PuuD
MRIINSMGSMVFRYTPEGMTQEYPYRTLGGISDLDQYMSERAGDAVLILEGGADINPALYGAECRKYTYFSESRDLWEVGLYAAARKYNVPIFGICRGHQLMAALAGGTLYQDLERENGAPHVSRHKITFTRQAISTRFEELMASCPTGRPDIVNSLHHQGVKDMPHDGVVLAFAADTVPEAIWYPYGASVQWHPELLGHTEFLLWLRDSFVGKTNE